MDPRQVIVERQKKLAPFLQHIASFGPPQWPTTPADVTIADEAVTAWIARHPFVRSAMPPETARALAYLETAFGRHLRARA